MISVLLSVYNESERLPAFLYHATQWADEVVVCRKQGDPPNISITPPIWDESKVKAVDIPFTPQGHEDTVWNVAQCSHDWVFLMTPGETPTAELIRNVKAQIAMNGDKLDVIGIPKKLYSFGIHNQASPWSIGCQPMLFHRQRAIIRNHVHQNVTCKPDRFYAIPYSPTCHVLHPTHATVKGFLRSHSDYILAERAHADPDELIQRGLAMLNGQTFGNHNRELFGQECAWKLYWLGCCLAAFEKKRGRDVPTEYRAMTEELIAKEWT